MSRPSTEAGFTLVELLVAIVILSIVVGGLGQALVVGLKTTSATATTLVDVTDAGVLSSRLMTDVKGAQSLGATGGPACAPPGPAPAPARVLWTQAEGETAAYVVKHIPADPGTGTRARSELRRLRCAPGASTPVPAEGIVLARWPGVSEEPLIGCDGRQRSGGQTTLAAPLTATDKSVALLDSTGFPASDQPYDIVVDGETMSVTGGFGTSTLTLTARGPAAAAHAAGAVVTWGLGVLQAPVTAADTTLTLSDASAFPAAETPYPIVVDSEKMTVTGVTATALTVTRAAGVEHPAGRAVTFASCGAGGPAGKALLQDELSASGTELTVTDASGFPSTGPSYEIVVGGETMTVTGGYGTPSLTVTRTSGVPHAALDPVNPVSWTPRLVTIEVPRGDANGAPGGLPLTLAVSRRPT